MSNPVGPLIPADKASSDGRTDSLRCVVRALHYRDLRVTAYDEWNRAVD